MGAAITDLENGELYTRRKLSNVDIVENCISCQDNQSTGNKALVKWVSDAGSQGIERTIVVSPMD